MLQLKSAMNNDSQVTLDYLITEIDYGMTCHTRIKSEEMAKKIIFTTFELRFYWLFTPLQFECPSYGIM
jgi:hypothetical protein